MSAQGSRGVFEVIALDFVLGWVGWPAFHPSLGRKVEQSLAGCPKSWSKKRVLVHFDSLLNIN